MEINECVLMRVAGRSKSRQAVLQMGCLQRLHRISIHIQYKSTWPFESTYRLFFVKSINNIIAKKSDKLLNC